MNRRYISTLVNMDYCLRLFLLSLVMVSVVTVTSFTVGDPGDDGERESQQQQGDASDNDSPPPSEESRRRPQRQILVFGGNGFLGSEAVQLFIDNRDNVTMVNRGNWYWDSYDRIRPYVTHISCDRMNDLDSCQDLVRLIADSRGFDAVVDFSAYGPKESSEASVLLRSKAHLYILISTDSVYDVSGKEHDDYSREADSVRPEDESQRERLASHHEYGDKKLRAEEELIRQRWDQEQQDGATGGIPYIVLRLPDVIGPRDTTFRWWLYQLWVKLSQHIDVLPLSIPPFLADRNMSFVFSKDVAKLVFDLTVNGNEYQDEVYNVAFPEPHTLDDVILTIRRTLGLEHSELVLESNQSKTLFLYPSVRKGPLDVTKAQNVLSWAPTAWEQAVQETVDFFEGAMAGDKYGTQRDEIVQVLTSHLYQDNVHDVYDALEKIYGINLHHFRPREEL